MSEPTAAPSQAALARALGLSRASITKLKARGMPVHSVEAAHERRVNVAAREALLNIPARLAPLLAAESDPRRVQHLINAETRAALNAIAEGGP